jgi:hypothetical protein
LKFNKTQSRDGLLAHGELKTLFGGLTVEKYSESEAGKHAVASLIARKPKK